MVVLDAASFCMSRSVRARKTCGVLIAGPTAVKSGMVISRCSESIVESSADCAAIRSCTVPGFALNVIRPVAPVALASLVTGPRNSTSPAAVPAVS